MVRILERIKKSEVWVELQAMARMVSLVWYYVKQKNVMALAQSLAYTTILSLVPILAIFFSVLGKITENVQVQLNIQEFIATYFIPEYVSSIFVQIEKLSEGSLALGFIGFPTLFLIGVLLYVKVDGSINQIWSNENKKKWTKNLFAFFMTLFFGPMLLVLIFSIPPYLHTLPFYKEIINQPHIKTLVTQAVPLVIAATLLFFLYLYVPVTSVQYTAAFWGAVWASLLLQVSNLLLGFYLDNISNFDIIYGSLSAVPVFLLWVYLVWFIVLSGAVLAYVFQGYHITRYSKVIGKENEESDLYLAMEVMLYLISTFQNKDMAPDLDQVHLMLGIKKARLRGILETLEHAGLISSYERRTSKGNITERYQPGINPKKIKLCDLIPLFFHPRDQIVFGEDLNKLVWNLAVHPVFLREQMTLEKMFESPSEMLKKIQTREKQPD